MSYDVIIVGAGIAGLRVGLQLLRSKVSCCILEKYNYTGGRVVTFRTKLPKVGEVQWENGAGRISTSHKKVLDLLKRYDLHTAPIHPTFTIVIQIRPLLIIRIPFHNCMIFF